MQFCEDLTTTKAVVRTTEKWRTSESKEGRQPPLYQQLRGLRELQSELVAGRRAMLDDNFTPATFPDAVPYPYVE